MYKAGDDFFFFYKQFTPEIKSGRLTAAVRELTAHSWAGSVENGGQLPYRLLLNKDSIVLRDIMGITAKQRIHSARFRTENGSNTIQ